METNNATPKEVLEELLKSHSFSNLLRVLSALADEQAARDAGNNSKYWRRAAQKLTEVADNLFG